MVDSDNSFELPHKVALVHEWFTPRSVGGAEKVVLVIDELLKLKGCEIDLKALVDGESKMSESWLRGRSIETSFIQGLPFGIDRVQNYLPLLPFAIEQIDLNDIKMIV